MAAAVFRPALLRALRPARVAAVPTFRTFATTPRILSNILYTRTHEYITTTSPHRIGISAYAAHSLGDVVFVELPSVGEEVAAGETFGAVESVKSASDLVSPVSGKVVAVNDVLGDKPGLVNEDPEGEGWIVEVEVEGGVEEGGELIGAEEYKSFTSE